MSFVVFIICVLLISVFIVVYMRRLDKYFNCLPELFPVSSLVARVRAPKMVYYFY